MPDPQDFGQNWEKGAETGPRQAQLRGFLLASQ